MAKQRSLGRPSRPVLGTCSVALLSIISVIISNASIRSASVLDGTHHIAASAGPARIIANAAATSSATTPPATNWTEYFRNFAHNVTTHWESSPSQVPIRQTNASSSSDCAPASLILFGVPKEFGRIWKGYVRRIVRRNPRIHFEVHMHMHSDLHLHNFTNAKNGEINVTVASPSDVQQILMGNISVQGEHGNVSIPTRLVTSSQREYDESGLSWMEEGDLRHMGQNVFTNLNVLSNVFRQGNSMRQAYASAATRPFYASGDENKRTYVFLRSDTLLISDEVIPCGLATNEVHVPSWQTKGFPELNDRTAVAGPIAAHKYARAKSDAFREMILDRRNPGSERHAWSSAKRMKEHLDKTRFTYNNIGQRPTLHNPEKMLNFYLNHDELDGPKLKVVERDGDWMKLIRVRSGGRMHDAGRWRVEARFLNETDLRRR